MPISVPLPVKPGVSNTAQGPELAQQRLQSGPLDGSEKLEGQCQF